MAKQDALQRELVKGVLDKYALNGNAEGGNKLIEAIKQYGITLNPYP